MTQGEIASAMGKRLVAVYDELRAIDRELFSTLVSNNLRDPIKTAMGRVEIAVYRMERAELGKISMWNDDRIE